jgi:hypothetical protein
LSGSKRRDKTGLVETVIVPRARDLGGFEVRRALPSRERQMIGPFIFFDQMGPAEFRSGQGIDVRPHPHTKLATVSYLFEAKLSIATASARCSRHDGIAIIINFECSVVARIFT